MRRFMNSAVNGDKALQLSSVANLAGRNLATTTEKYQFIPTATVLSVLDRAGWKPYRASQARANKSENEGFQKHQIRLRRMDQIALAGVVPEIVLTNAHGGTSAFDLRAGLFELVCSNGLIVAREEYGHSKVRHVGYTDQKVVSALDLVVSTLPKVLETRKEWQEIDITPAEATLYAETALKVRDNHETHVIHPREVLYARHYEQRENTLWNVYNRVQENIIKGGVRQTNTESRQSRRTRPVTNIGNNTKINTLLWELTEGFAALKRGN